MNVNESQIKEPNDELDSLIMLIKERAKLITIDNVPEASNIKYIPYNLKRGAEQVLIPAPESNSLLANIIQTYLLTAFSDDLLLVQEIKKKLKIKPNEDWFFDLNKLVSEIKSISNTDEIFVNEYEVLRNIHDYIGSKITATIIKKYGSYKNNEPISVERVRNYTDTRNKAKRENRNTIINDDTDSNEYVLSLAGEIVNDTEKSNFQMLQSFAKGNMESQYFPEIFKNFIKVTNKIKEGEKYLLVFNLFKMVIRDRNFYTEEEFYDSEFKFTNYNAYKKKVVKNILQLK